MQRQVFPVYSQTNIGLQSNVGKVSDHGVCELCQRRTALTRHHLIPRKLHRRNHFRKRYSPQQLQATVLICGQCHRGIHKLHDEMTLGRRLCTLQQLRSDEAVMKHVLWVARQKIAAQRGVGANE